MPMHFDPSVRKRSQTWLRLHVPSGCKWAAVCFWPLLKNQQASSDEAYEFKTPPKERSSKTDFPGVKSIGIIGGGVMGGGIAQMTACEPKLLSLCREPKLQRRGQRPSPRQAPSPLPLR